MQRLYIIWSIRTSKKVLSDKSHAIFIISSNLLDNTKEFMNLFWLTPWRNYRARFLCSCLDCPDNPSSPRLKDWLDIRSSWQSDCRFHKVDLQGQNKWAKKRDKLFPNIAHRQKQTFVSSKSFSNRFMEMEKKNWVVSITKCDLLSWIFCTSSFILQDL